MDVVQLLNQIGKSVEYVNQRQAAADKVKADADADLAKAKAEYDSVLERTKAEMDASSQDLARAKDELQGLREQLYSALGDMSAVGNPRVMISK
mgnify:CR=1 FL=1